MPANSIDHADPRTTRDRIRLEGMRFFGYHGVNPEEQALGQRFEVDLEIAADLRSAGETDDLTQTINYAAAFKRVRAKVEQERFRLIEALAHAVSLDILREFELAKEVVVTIRKPGAAITGSILDAATVTIRRDRSDLS